MNNDKNRAPHIHEGHNRSKNSDPFTVLEENKNCLTYLIERYFHPKVICVDQGGTCTRLQDTILFLSRNQKREEMLMKQVRYPYLRAHEREHETILRNLNTLKRTLVCGRYENDLVFDFVMEWAESHTEGFDKPFSVFLKLQKIEIFQSGGL